MKKFLKKYGYILLVVVIAAGCYTGFRAFWYYYHDTDDYCLRTYGTMARVEEKCGKTGLLHMENAGNWSSHDYWLKYPKDEPENPEDITCYYDWGKENHTVYQIDFHKNGVTLEEYMGRYHQDPPEGSGQYTDTDLWTDFPVPVYYDAIVYPHTYEPSGYAFFEYGDAYYSISVSSREEARTACAALFASAES